MSRLIFYIGMISSFNEVIADFSSNEITNSVLVQVAMKIIRIERVVEELGYDCDYIDRLRADYRDAHSEVCYQALLQWWERPLHNSSTRLKQLHRSLCKTGQPNCLQKVFREDEYYKRITYVSRESGIAEQTLARDIDGNQNLLNDIARYLSGNWRTVGRLLDLEECEIEEIQSDYRKSAERAYRMLDRWRQKKGSAAKVSQLAAALLIVNKYEALKVIEKNMKIE